MTEQDSPPVAPDGPPPEPDAPEPSVEVAGGPAPERPPPAPSAPIAEPPFPPWQRYGFLAALSVVSLALDLGTKVWAKGHLEGHRRVEVLTNHLYFTFARNRGGAWGLLQDEPESIRRPFFVVISVLAIVFIVSLYRRLTPQQWALKWGLPLVLGGALGNLINRIQYNYVVDFIDFRSNWIGWLNAQFSNAATDHWPTFNIADVAIVAGVVLMGVDMFTTRKAPRPAGAAGDASPDVPKQEAGGEGPAAGIGADAPKPAVDGGPPSAPVEP
jgi:signal peptidase II